MNEPAEIDAGEEYRVCDDVVMSPPLISTRDRYLVENEQNSHSFLGDFP